MAGRKAVSEELHGGRKQTREGGGGQRETKAEAERKSKRGMHFIFLKQGRSQRQ